jgi:small-conductance mechanosensitive channel
MSDFVTAPRRLRRAGPLVTLITAFCCSAPPALAVTTADSAAVYMTLPGADVAGEPARLTVNNRDIIEFRGSFLGYSPAERAEAAAARIREAIGAHPRGDREAVIEVRQVDRVWLFHLDGRLAFGVTPADVNALDGETMDMLVERTRQNLQAAVSASLEQRTFSRLIRGILFAVLATIIFWLLLRGLIRLVRWTAVRVEQAVGRRTERLHLPPSALFHQFGVIVRGLTRVVGVVLGIALADVWLTFVLKQFPYTYPWGDRIDEHIIAVASTIGLAVLHAIPNLLMLVLIYVIARFVIRWVRLFFEAVREGRIDAPGLDAETAVPAQRLVILFLVLLAVAIAYPFIPGSGGTAFKGLSVLFGLMLSLGSSNVVSQAASGYMLMFSKALRVNDYVRVGEYEGTVLSVGVLSTKIRTPRNEEINVPNSVVVGTTTKNYTRLNRESGAPVNTSVTIGYGIPWRQVHAMLLEAAGLTNGLRKVPEPRVLQSSLSDFYVEYTLVARLEQPEGRALVLSELHANIQDVFNEYGVQIMSPHYEGDPDGKVWVPRERWHEAPAGERPGPGARTSKGSE